MRTCSRCNLIKEDNHFHFLNKKNNILRPECKLCRKQNVPSYKQKLITNNPNNKICSKCLIETSKNNFNQSRGKCKQCSCAENKKWREENAEYLKSYRKQRYPIHKLLVKSWIKNNPKRNAIIKSKANKKWIALHPDLKRQMDSKKYYRNRNIILAQHRAYFLNNRASIRFKAAKYSRIKRKNDPSFRLRVNISRAVNYALKKAGSTKSKISVLDKLEYSVEELKIYLEQQFEWWMNWNNQGIYIPSKWDDNDPSTWVWQLDHIIPQSDLLYLSMDDDNFKKCWALFNLRPLSAKQNHTDGVNRVRHQ